VAIAGAAFGLTGAVYQGALKNDLASPTTLGVDQGATLGMTIFVLLLQGTMLSVSHLPISDIAYMMGDLTFINWVWMMYGRMICALLGSFAAVAVVLLIARVAGHGHTSSLWIIVAGSILATALSSVSSLIDIYFETTGSIAQEELATVVSAKSFTQIHSFVDVGLLVVPVGICLFILIAMRSKLGVLSFGEDEARSMGVDPHRTSNIMIGVTTFMSAVVISICGNVAFLGFIVPHITRRWIGADFRYLVPASALCGSIVLLVSYYASSIISQEASSYVSMFMSLIGFAAFIFMFFGKQGWGRHAGE
jgi:iron complex transport system permease protein